MIYQINKTIPILLQNQIAMQQILIQIIINQKLVKKQKMLLVIGEKNLFIKYYKINIQKRMDLLLNGVIKIIISAKDMILLS